jgi:hypothetical protein
LYRNEAIASPTVFWKTMAPAKSSRLCMSARGSSDLKGSAVKRVKKVPTPENAPRAVPCQSKKA